MKKEIIRNNPLINSGLRSQGQQKTRLFNEAKALIEEHIGKIPNEDYKLFGASFRTYIVNEFRKRTKDFAPHFSEAKLLEFFDFPNHVLQTIETKWGQLRFVEMSEDYQSVILQDDNIYAETEEEIERLKNVRTLIKSLEYIVNDGYYIDFNALSRACPNIIVPTGNKSAEANEHYIKKYRF
jgi:hypothetical protein